MSAEVRRTASDLLGPKDASAGQPDPIWVPPDSAEVKRTSAARLPLVADLGRRLRRCKNLWEGKFHF